jgi:hypothetical protein
MKRFWLFLLSELMPIRIKIFCLFTKFEIVKVLISETFLDRTEKNRDILKYLVFKSVFCFYVSSIPILYHLRIAVKSPARARFHSSPGLFMKN